MRKSLVLFYLLFTGFFVNFAQLCKAEVYRFTWNPVTDGSSAHPIAGEARKFEVVYNNVTKHLTWLVDFYPHNGVLPNGFELAFNNGPNPKGYAGELAFLYFDAVNIHAPVITVYGYNGIDIDSWKDGSEAAGQQLPDRILSSRATLGTPNNPTDWLYRVIAQDNPNGSRTFGFVMNLTPIQTHSPLYPALTPWIGGKIDQKLGMWFHPMVLDLINYDASGFLSALTRSELGWYDTAEQTTVLEDPICSGISGNTVVKVGSPFNATFTGIDNQHNPLTVSYFGLPSGAQVTPTNGTTLAQPTTATFSWTPKSSDHGQSYYVQVVFTDPYGATAECPFRVSVPANVAPVCNTGVETGYQNLACTNAKTVVSLNGAASHDPDKTAPLTYQWSSNCAGGVFSNSQDIAPSFTFNSEDSNGLPVACQASLTVSDGILSSSCIVPISVSGCLKDCAGAINGTNQFDLCGVCGGDGKSCLDCSGKPNGTASFDLCGVCNGKNECLDCAGKPFGVTKIDRCGECGGDGNSCLGCTQSDITKLLISMDVSAHSQRRILRNAVSRLKRASTTNSTRSFIKETLATALKLQNENWRVTWSLPPTQVNCSNSSLCIRVSNSETIQQYSKNAKLLRDLALRVVTRLSPFHNIKDRNIRRLVSSINKEYANALSAVGAVPTSFSSCS